MISYKSKTTSRARDSKQKSTTLGGDEAAALGSREIKYKRKIIMSRERMRKEKVGEMKFKQIHFFRSIGCP